MSRRNLELVFLVLAGAVSTMAYVSVYAGRFREINRVSIIYGLDLRRRSSCSCTWSSASSCRRPTRSCCRSPLCWPPWASPRSSASGPSLALAQGQWLLVGAALFILTVLIVRDHMKLDRYRYLIGAVGLALLVLTIVIWARRSTAPSSGSTRSASASSRRSSPSSRS